MCLVSKCPQDQRHDYGIHNVEHNSQRWLVLVCRNTCHAMQQDMDGV
jgi:hypothetical protein